MPKTTSWNIGIQILRGIAATLVVFHHSLEESLAISTTVAPEWLIRFGACGVDIFFVISGFIIYSVTYGRAAQIPERPSPFLLKRLTRIFPLYWIFLLATLALWSTGYFYRSLRIDAPILGSSIFLLPSKAPIVGVAWTLVYEMYFYYLFFITLHIRNARLSVLTTTLLICSGLLLSRFLPEGGLKDFLSNPIALEFSFGLILSYFIHSGAFGWSGLRYLWLPGLLLMAGAAALAEKHSSTSVLAANVRYFAWGLPAVLVTLSFIRTEFAKTLADQNSGADRRRLLRHLLKSPEHDDPFRISDQISHSETDRLSDRLAAVTRHCLYPLWSSRSLSSRTAAFGLATSTSLSAKVPSPDHSLWRSGSTWPNGGRCRPGGTSSR